MGRQVASLIVFVIAALFAAAPAAAGDRASFNALGFSEDSRYFAFEEFGYQDGSGFPFSTIYLIDLAQDSWVSGSPFRVRLDDETAKLSAAREQAYADAQDALHARGIDYPAEVAALSGDGYLGDTKQLRFGIPFYGLEAPNGDYTLSLSTFPADSAEPCEDYLSEKALGFALTLSGDGPDRELHRDTTIPASRFCPMDYRIFAALTPLWNAEVQYGVAIISVYPLGFEGPDRRFIAVPLRNGL